MLDLDTKTLFSYLCWCYVAVLDASGKLPNGLFSGTAATFGHFEQCLDIRVGDLEDGGFR